MLPCSLQQPCFPHTWCPFRQIQCCFANTIERRRFTQQLYFSHTVMPFFIPMLFLQNTTTCATIAFSTHALGFWAKRKPRNKICSLAKFLQNDEATKHQHKNQRVGRANNLAVEPVQQTTVAGKQFAKIFDVAKAL